VLRWLSSGLLRRVDWYKFTGISEQLAASTIRAMSTLMIDPEEQQRRSHLMTALFCLAKRRSME
jgi:hypothetical protein